MSLNSSGMSSGLTENRHFVDKVPKRLSKFFWGFSKNFWGQPLGAGADSPKTFGGKIKQKTQGETDKTVSSVLKKDYFFLYGPRGLPVGTTSSRFLGIASIWAFFL